MTDGSGEDGRRNSCVGLEGERAERTVASATAGTAGAGAGAASSTASALCAAPGMHASKPDPRLPDAWSPSCEDGGCQCDMSKCG